jgi:hypothetical protein
MTDDRSDLRKRFEDLRAEDSRWIPEFNPSPQRPTRLPARTWFAAAAALLFLFAALATVIGVRSERTRFTESDRAVVRSVAAWRPPTAFLLRTPGSEILATTPVILDPDVLRLGKGAAR